MTVALIDEQKSASGCRVQANAAFAGLLVKGGYWAPMSQEIVDLVRTSMEQLNAVGWDTDAATMGMHPEGRLYPPAEWPGPEVYEGRSGWAALIGEWTSAFDGLRGDIDRLIDDGDRVIVLLRMSGTSKAGGVEVEWPLGYIASDFADGRSREVRWFISQEQTLAAAGLSPSS